jgi:hypothetical protein
MLAVSIDSMCEWAPCPDEWYEPEPESLPLKASSMMELLTTGDRMFHHFGTFLFPLLTLGAIGQTEQTPTNRPTQGFSPDCPSQSRPNFPRKQQVNRKSTKVSRNYPETIPKLFHRVVAGSSTQPARSPPGGDAMLKDYLREGLDNFSSQNQTPRSSFFQGEGDRFLSQYPLPKNKTMLLEISVPVYRRDRWGRLERDGKIQVSSEVDTLSEGYKSLKKSLMLC